MIKTLSTYQIILLILSLYFVIQRITKFFTREKGQTLFKLLTSLVVWFGIFLFTLFPPLGHFLTSKLGFGENLNTLIFIGFIVVFIILFKFLNIIEEHEKSITEIIRQEAIKNIFVDKKE